MKKILSPGPLLYISALFVVISGVIVINNLASYLFPIIQIQNQKAWLGGIATKPFSHINTFIPGKVPMDSDYQNWVRSHIDMTASYEPITGKDLVRRNWSDFDISNRADYFLLIDEFDNQGADIENMFLHYAEDIKVTTKRTVYGNLVHNAFNEDRFFQILSVGEHYWDLGPKGEENDSLKLIGQPVNIQLKSGWPKEINDEFTFELWIKLDGDQINKQILGNRNANSLSIDSAGRIVFDVTTTGGNKSIRQKIDSISQWHHIAGVVSGKDGDMFLYVDGEVVQKNKLNQGPIKVDKDSFSVGGILNAGSSVLVGNLSDIRIYNRLLSSQEVNDRFNNNISISNGLIGWWKMNNTDGFVIKDSSPAGRDAFFGAEVISRYVYGDYNPQNGFPGYYDLKLGAGRTGEVYIGNPWKINEINFNVSQGSVSGWDYTIEYSTGSVWKTIDVIQDTTSNFNSSGTIRFKIPDDWGKLRIDIPSDSNWELLDVKGNASLYWIRIRSKKDKSSQAPTVQSVTNAYSPPLDWDGISAISGKKYKAETINNIDYFIIPGWNPLNDKDRNGYIDDAEFVSLVDPKATARFKRESRVPSNYTANRWVTLVNNPIYMNFASSRLLKMIQYKGVVGGFVDNTTPGIVDIMGGNGKYVELTGTDSPHESYFSAQLEHLRNIKSQLGSRLLFINSGHKVRKETLDIVDGVFWERILSFSNTEEFTEDFINAIDSTIQYATNINKKIVIHSDSGRYFYPSDVTTGRNSLYCLAGYYILGTNQTFFDFQDGTNYSRPKEDWFKAIEYDIGKPLEKYKPIHVLSSQDTSKPNLLKNPSFENSSNGVVPVTDWQLRLNNSNDQTTLSLSEDRKDGKYSLLINIVGGNSSGLLSQNIILKPNTVYTFSGWIKTQGLIGTNLLNKAATISLTSLSSEYRRIFYGGDQDWMPFNVIFNTGSKGEVYLYPTVWSAKSGKIWIDDVKLVEGSYPDVTIFERNYENAKILWRPNNWQVKSYGSETQVEVSLSQDMSILNSDGTLGSSIKKVNIKNGEGVILIGRQSDISISTPTPTPPPGGGGGPTPTPTPPLSGTPTPTPDPSVPTPTPTPPPPPGGTNGFCGSTLNACSRGILRNTEDSNSQYLWMCLGLNGGQDANCAKDRFFPPPPTNPIGNRPRTYTAPTIDIPDIPIDTTEPNIPSWLDVIVSLLNEIITNVTRGAKRVGGDVIDLVR